MGFSHHNRGLLELCFDTAHKERWTHFGSFQQHSSYCIKRSIHGHVQAHFFSISNDIKVSSKDYRNENYWVICTNSLSSTAQSAKSCCSHLMVDPVPVSIPVAYCFLEVHYIILTTYQKAFIFEPQVPCRISFYSMTLGPRVHVHWWG